MAQMLRVLELGGGVSAAYAAKLLGDHGAAVVKVEPPGGDPSRQRGPFPGGRPNAEKSGLFLALNVNKRGVCLDLDCEAGAASLGRLLEWADILVHNLPKGRAAGLGLDAATLRERFPALVVLSITPFGVAGPYSDYVGSELIVSNAGGWAALAPATRTDASLPPLKVFGSQCGLMAGVVGAMTALAVHRDVSKTGVGEHIDLSEQGLHGIRAGSGGADVRLSRPGAVSISRPAPDAVEDLPRQGCRRFSRLRGRRPVGASSRLHGAARLGDAGHLCDVAGP